MCEEKKIRDWDELLAYYKDEITKGNWMFRAEKANCHPLETSLDKAFDDCDVDDCDVSDKKK